MIKILQTYTLVILCGLIATSLVNIVTGHYAQHPIINYLLLAITVSMTWLTIKDITR